MDKARNDLSAAVPKFCLALEEHRRTPDGRVRTSQELLTTFFPHDDKVCTDRILKYLPNEVRGPIIAAWGIRGIKAALRDPDEKVQNVLYDALIAGDIDHAAFEEGLSAETLVRWVPLGDLWTFWRGGKLTKQAIHKALSTAYELFLFDARWFLETISARSGALKGTDVLADGLSKEDLTHWVRRINETGDGSPKGMVAALGWDKIVAKTPNEVLVASLDAVAVKVGLIPATSSKEIPKPAESSPKAVEAKAEARPEAKPEPAPAAAEPPPGAAAKPAPAPSTMAKPAGGDALGPSAPPEAKPAGRPSSPEFKPFDRFEKLVSRPAPSGPSPSRAVSPPTPKENVVAMPPQPEEPTWSDPPPPLVGGEELINVVLDDEEIVSSAPEDPGSMVKAAGPKSTYDEDEQTIIKPLKRISDPPPPQRPPTRR